MRFITASYADQHMTTSSDGFKARLPDYERLPGCITLSPLRLSRDPDEGKHQSPRTFSAGSSASSSTTWMATLRNTSTVYGQ